MYGIKGICKNALKNFKSAKSTKILKFIISPEPKKGPEIRNLLDSAINLDPNFAMALEMYPTSDQLLAREYEEKAKQLSDKIKT